jgi:TPR repeat protein
VPQDNFEAIRWYRLAANQGYAPAQYTLSNLCRALAEACR